MSEPTGGYSRRKPERVAEKPSCPNTGHLAAGRQHVVDPKLVSARNPFGVPSIRRLIQEVDAGTEGGSDPGGKVALMKLMWETGSSASEIASEMGLQAESVVGVARRLKWRRN